MKNVTKMMTVLAILSAAMWGLNSTELGAVPPAGKGGGTPWLQASGSTTQAVGLVATQVNIDTLDGSNAVTLSGGSAVVTKAGDYLVVAAPQVGNTGVGLADFKCWIGIEGNYVTNSNVLLSLQSWTKDVIVTQGVVTLERGDSVSVYVSASAPGVEIQAISPPGEPLVPSIIFTLYRIR
jgi:hypothetical protein